MEDSRPEIPFNNYIVCPYDSVHRLLPTRLAVHLIRCARNHVSTKMVNCPFNNTHVLTVAKMKDHVVVCPNRSALVRFHNPDKVPPIEPKAAPHVLVETMEDWDNEPDVPTYNPKSYCDKNLIIRNPQGAPPAARRQFRELERRRFNESGMTKQEPVKVDSADDKLQEIFYKQLQNESKQK